MSKRKDKKEQQRAEDRDVATEQADAAEAEALRERVGELERELEQMREKYQRVWADYENYRKRSMINEREAREWGVASVLESVVGVLDHFDVALSQDPERATAASIIDGVQMIKGELLKSLQEHGVSTIDPEVGEEPDPNRHDAMGHRAAEGVEPGRISATLQAGYTMGDRVLRPAKVFIAPEQASAGGEQGEG